MDIRTFQTICHCFIGAGLVVPVLDALFGIFGGIFDFDLDLDGEPGFDGPVFMNVMVLSLTAVLFGSVGRLCSISMPVLNSILISIPAALSGGWLFGRFVIRPLKRSKPLASGIRDAAGKEGIVKLEIRSDFIGTIRVLNASGSHVTYSARPDLGIDRIPIGTKVVVVFVDSEKQCCVVRPIGSAPADSSTGQV